MIIGQGSRGPLVKRLQEALKKQGFGSATADGIFGANTKAAVQAFQTSKGLPADGIAGPQVFTALGISDESETSKSKTTVSSQRENASSQVERTAVFISYSHQDKKWLERLQIHLKPLTQDANIQVWDDTLLEPGTKWQNAIKKAMASAKVAVLLISADFLASSFITTNELPPLLAAAESEGTVILPVIISPSRFTKTPALSQFQTVNSPERPLEAMSKTEREKVFMKVADSVERAFKS